MQGELSNLGGHDGWRPSLREGRSISSRILSNSSTLCTSPLDPTVRMGLKNLRIFIFFQQKVKEIFAF
jgi:hypothetical protein